MCGIDPGELTPFQGGPFIGRFPGLKHGLLNPAVPFEAVILEPIGVIQQNRDNRRKNC